MPRRSGLEGFGLTPREAVVCGIRLVVSWVDALQDVLIESKTGLLLTP